MAHPEKGLTGLDYLDDPEGKTKRSQVERGVMCPDCREARGLLGLALYVARNRLLDITNKEHDEAFEKIRDYLIKVGFIEAGT